MSVCLIILFETAINTSEYIYNKSLNMCLLNCQIANGKKKIKNCEPIEIFYFFYHSLMLLAYSLAKLCHPDLHSKTLVFYLVRIKTCFFQK